MAPLIEKQGFGLRQSLKGSYEEETTPRNTEDGQAGVALAPCQALTVTVTMGLGSCPCLTRMGYVIRVPEAMLRRRDHMEEPVPNL